MSTTTKSEGCLAAFLAEVPVGLAELAADGRFRYANQALGELLGRTGDEVLELRLADLTHPEDARASRAACARVIQGAEPVTLRTRYMSPDGTALRMTSRLKRIENEHGEAQLALAVMADTTPSDGSLQCTPEQPLRWLLDNVREYAILLLDPTGHIQVWGAGAQQVFGYAEATIVGQPFDVLFTPEDRAAGVVAQGLATARARGQAPEERWHRRQSGELFWASGVIAALHDAEGALRGYAKICRDLTEQRQTDDRRAEQLTRETSARAAAEQATEAKDAFLATVSHELRTPLATMLMWAKILEHGTGGERERARGLAAIVRGGEAQRQLLEDLLDLSRMVAGTLRIELADADLAAIIRAAVDPVQPMARAKGVELASNLGNDETILVHGDAARLQQIVWNILTNAVKFTTSGGRVELGLEITPGVARVVVRDTGRGIDAAFLPHVFDRFRQGQADAARPAAGLGLGLSIVRELVALHGGRVDAASDGPGCGATFTVELPRLERAASILPSPPALEPLHDAGARPLAGVTVLLVEDDVETQKALIWLLESAGADVTATASASSALAALDDRWPDVLLSDIGLPGEDGYELMGRVSAYAASQGRPAPSSLALTAYARGEDRERALSVGFSAYASKPIEPRALLETVTALAASCPSAS